MTINSKQRWCLFLFGMVFAIAALFAFLPVLDHGLSAQDHPRTSEVCLDCHDTQAQGLLGTPHQIVPENIDDAVVACTDCHPGDPRHYDEDAEEYAMTIPDTLDAWSEAQICKRCHENSHQQNMLERNVHMANQVNCSDCHRVHVVHDADSTLGAGQYRATNFTGLLKTNEIDLCLGCHVNVRGQFAKPSHHPVEEGAVKCSECHMQLDRTKRAMSFMGTSAPCFECHNEFQMPFPYEHQATVDYSVEEGACLNCHEPHGSNLRVLLKQPYEGSRYQLCSQCHSVPPKHNLNTFHGDRWAGLPCSDCHVDIHGSYTSRYFFGKELEAQGCTRAGCHSS
jgi:DmsE family decaheme c-type cytochrome